MESANNGMCWIDDMIQDEEFDKLNNTYQELMDLITQYTVEFEAQKEEQNQNASAAAAG